jgi:hypothetical protein
MKTQTIQQIKMFPYQSKSDLPFVFMILVGLLAASPLGGTVIFNNGVPLAGNVSSILGLFNSLILDRYFYRGLMTAGYIVQNQSKIIAAIPVAIKMISEAVERVIWTLFGLPGLTFVQINNCESPFAVLVATRIESMKGNGQVQTPEMAQIRMLKLGVTDDFFWHSTVLFETSKAIIEKRSDLDGLASLAKTVST